MTEEEQLQRDIETLEESVKLDLEDIAKGLVGRADAAKHIQWCREEWQALKARLTNRLAGIELERTSIDCCDCGTGPTPAGINIIGDELSDDAKYTTVAGTGQPKNRF